MCIFISKNLSYIIFFRGTEAVVIQIGHLIIENINIKFKHKFYTTGTEKSNYQANNSSCLVCFTINRKEKVILVASWEHNDIKQSLEMN